MRVKKTFNEPDEGRCYEFLYDSTDVSSHRHARMHFLLANFLYNAHLHTQIYRFWMPTKHPTLKDIERTTLTGSTTRHILHYTARRTTCRRGNATAIPTVRRPSLMSCVVTAEQIKLVIEIETILGQCYLLSWFRSLQK